MALWEMVREQKPFKTEEFNELTRHQVIRRLIGTLVRDVCQATAARLEKANLKSVEELQRLPSNVIGHSEALAGPVRELKDFLYKNMYYHYRTVRMARKAERFLTMLFEVYMDDPEQLPDSVRSAAEGGGAERARAICDYIAGMTDRYALQEHEKLFEPFSRP
jgi:dGTPase